MGKFLGLVIFLFACAWNGITCLVNDENCGRNLKLEGFAGPRVVTTSNGDTGPPGSWPWMVSAGEFSPDGIWEHRCGGTIIAPNLVLTAAHCTIDNNWLIRSGDRDLDSNFDDAKVISRKIKKTHIHPKYVYDLTAYYDVAIWELDANVEYNIFHRPVCLPTEASLDLNKYEGDQVTVLGWGLQSTTGGKSDNILKQTPVKVFPNRYCNATHSNFDSNILQFRAKATLPNLFTDHLMCAGYELGNFGSCTGDSGGPIVRLLTTPPNIRYLQVGIVQGGVGDCGDSRYPGIYIRLDDPDIFGFIQNVVDPGSTFSVVQTSVATPIENPESSGYDPFQGPGGPFDIAFFEKCGIEGYPPCDNSESSGSGSSSFGSTSAPDTDSTQTTYINFRTLDPKDPETFQLIKFLYDSGALDGVPDSLTSFGTPDDPGPAFSFGVFANFGVINPDDPEAERFLTLLIRKGAVPNVGSPAG